MGPLVISVVIIQSGEQKHVLIIIVNRHELISKVEGRLVTLTRLAGLHQCSQALRIHAWPIGFHAQPHFTLHLQHRPRTRTTRQEMCFQATQ